MIIAIFLSLAVQLPADTVALSVDDAVRQALLQASGRRDRSQLEASLRDSLGRKLAELNNQLQEGAAQLLFAVDNQGEIIAQLGGSTPPAGASSGKSSSGCRF